MTNATHTGKINWREYSQYLIQNFVAPHVLYGGCCAYAFLGQERQGPCMEGGNCTSYDCLIKALKVEQERFREVN